LCWGLSIFALPPDFGFRVSDLRRRSLRRKKLESADHAIPHCFALVARRVVWHRLPVMCASGSETDWNSACRDPRDFRTTHWSLVLAAGQGASPGAQAALETLCRAYWYPLYAYVRRLGHNPEDAQDLTQGFFTRLLQRDFFARAQRERGRFRAFLLTALKHHLGDARDYARAAKRGGGQPLFSLDEQQAEGLYRHEPVEVSDPERIFERRWALKVLEAARARLRDAYAAEDKAAFFELIEQFLPGEESALTYPEAAARLGVAEATVRSDVFRLKQRFRKMVRAEVVQTVANPAEVDEEIRHLIAVLSR
jgi:RNA polymerase sigma-70 factor (ECF subfamily)